MAANSFNREEARDKFASILETTMVGAPAIAQAVYNYKVKKLNGFSPVVTVTGLSSKRDKNQFGNTYNARFALEVTVFVLWVNENATPQWTEAMCEDRLDLIDKTLADAVMDHKSAAQDATVPWDTIYFDGESVGDVWLEGALYWTETYRLVVEKLHG